MYIKTLAVGNIETNCYIVTDGGTRLCAVIDPGDESNAIMDYLESNKLKCEYIFLTHGHYDHVMAAKELERQTGATIYIHKLDVGSDVSAAQFRLKPDEKTRYFNEGDTFSLGSLEFKILHTPGHTPGGVTIICQNALFTGDTLFRDSCGRTDLPGGDGEALRKSLLRLADLPGEYEVYPGHMDATTLDRERRFNYYIKLARETKQ